MELRTNRRLAAWMLAGGAAALSTIGLAGRASGRTQELPTVHHVDLQRYLGTWYEIARLPARFERDCFGVTATYSLRDDGELSVTNRCRKGSFSGRLSEATGRAKVVDPESNAKLKVYFFGPFGGDYWILELGPDYEYALVGEPGRKYLWILSREPHLDRATFERLFQRASELGFPTEKLIMTPQPE